MAKRGRKKKKNYSLLLRPEVIAVLLIIISIVGFFKFGPVGRFIAAISLYFTGYLYMVFFIN